MRLFLAFITTLFFIPVTQAKTYSDTPAISVYPRVNEGKFFLVINAPSSGTAKVDLLNRLGNTVFSQFVQVTSGTNQVHIDVNKTVTLTDNIYYLYITLNHIRSNAVSMTILQHVRERSDSIDVLHYDLGLSIRNLSSKTISGTARLTITSKADSLSTFYLDLLALDVTRVSVNGTDQSFTRNDSMLFITLDSLRQQGDTFELAVDYNGQPVSDLVWGGFYFSGNYAYNMGVGFKSIPHNFGRCWFPCVDNFTDRATYAFHITTDSNFRAVCNGLTQPEITHPDGSITWNWELGQPIPTYLASVAVSKYVFVKYEFTGISRTYPVWLAAEAKDTAKVKASCVHLNNALQCFEQKFGPYLFDRVGYVGVPFTSGAMEHASNISYPIVFMDGTTNYETTMAHELSHHWWGDLATCRSAEDMWLNEGWASFCEALFLECLYGREVYISDIKSKLLEVLKNAPVNDKGYQPVSGINSDITYGTHVYKKGALVVHSLRTVMGDDAFFNACKSYLQDHHFKDVSSEDLKQAFQSFTAVDLTDFFNKWIYDRGHADVVISSVEMQPGNATNFLKLKLEQRYRMTSGYRKTLPVNVFVYNDQMHVQVIPVTVGNTPLDTTLLFNFDFIPALVTVNEDLNLALGCSYDKLVIKSTGAKTLGNSMLTLNVTNVTDSALLYIEHHWTEPSQNDLLAKGIVISPERYWRVDGIIPSSFSCIASFTYNGMAANYLDRELMMNMVTEDSLVLLYRPTPSSDWQVHTDNSFVPGIKTDKAGMFKVNQLQKGDYAFGIKNVTVTGVNNYLLNAKASDGMRIYPNPAHNEITIELDQLPKTSYSLTVFNVKGQPIKEYPSLKEKSLQINVEGWSKGIYYVVVETPAGKMTKPFVK